jgi:hypothetical protein
MAPFEARDKARPTGPKIRVGAGVRVRRDRIDKGGKVTLRHGSRLHHIGVGHARKGKRVILLINGLDVRVVSADGELPSTSHAGSNSGLPAAGIVRSGYDAPAHPATMRRHITWWALEDLNL